MSLNLSPITKAIHAIIGATDGILVAVAAIDPSTLPPKWAAAFIVAQHIALIFRREGPIVDAALPKAQSDIEQFIREIQSTPEIPQAIIDQVAAATPAA
jgi:hypothetical protein